MSSDAAWDSPPTSVTPRADEVHVWRVPLELPDSAIDVLLLTLSDDERARAGRFHFKKDRSHYVAARATLRALLGLYLRAPAAGLAFRYTYYGKPSLAEPFDRGPLRFNVSHSHGLALIAVACGREVGVDLEWIRPGVAGEQIAERFFSAAEVGVLRALPAGLQDEGFFNCWTRKESYIKAKGEGLSMPLDLFDVSLTPGEPAALLSTRPDSEEASRWTLRELRPGPGYVGAVAAEGRDWRLKCWQWEGGKDTGYSRQDSVDA